MKKKLLALLLGFSLVLAACGDDEGDTAEEPSEDSGTDSEEVEEVAEDEDEAVEEEAAVDSELQSDHGTYEVVKSADNPESFEVGNITVDVTKAYLAEFRPDDPEGAFFDGEVNEDGVINVFVTEITVDNGEEEYVSFHPFAADVFVGGSKPYGGQAMLNIGDDDISAGSSEYFITAYNLEDEDDLSAISEVSVEMWAPSTEDGSVEDLEFTVTFE